MHKNLKKNNVILTLLGFWGAKVCLLITIVVVFRSLVPPGDFGGTTISTGLFDLLTNDSAARTTSNTYIKESGNVNKRNWMIAYDKFRNFEESTDTSLRKLYSFYTIAFYKN